MTQTATGTTRTLQDAFQAFTDMSAQLEASYRELERRAAELGRELAAARSERLRQLAEKERLANRLEKLLEALPGGVVVLDGDGRVQEFNPAAADLLGQPLLGETWHDVTARVLAPRSDDTHEVTLHDGRRITVSRRALSPEPGQILLLHDVTETRALQERVNRQQRLSAMGEMTAGLAHQIRTPLSAALLYAGHLGRADLGAAERERFGDKLLARLRHLERMVNDMLVYARGGTSGAEVIGVDGLAEELGQVLEPQLQARGALWRVDNRYPGAAVEGNREALLGALLNLATNALQACTGTPRLTLALEAAGDGALVLSLEDNGPGIPDPVRARIFEPFFTTRPDGTGLGLAVVQAVVRAHHGDVRVAAGSDGGTRFTLTIPTRQEYLPSGRQGAHAPRRAVGA